MGGTVDFIFLIDGSGSMGPCMQALKENINIFLDEVTGPQSPVRDWRGKVVLYRDQTVDGTRWLADNPFVANDVTAFKEQLARIEAAGGGDEPESALDALHLVSTMPQSDISDLEADPHKWRYRTDAARVVILLTDASFRPAMTYPGGAGGTVNDVTNAMTNNKIILIMYAPNDAGWEQVAASNYCEWNAIEMSPTFVDGLKEIVSNRANFQKVMLALAKSVTRSTLAEVL